MEIATVLIIAGLIYLFDPHLFQRGFWKRTPSTNRLLKPNHNALYMRALGSVSVIVGVVLMVNAIRG